MIERRSRAVGKAASPVPIVASSRCVLLAEATRRLGRAWAEEWFDDLRRQGRPIAGGWPGTMSEARSRVRHNVDAMLTKQSLPPMSHDELTEGAQLTYETARSLWFNFRVRDEDIG
jgi:hypothetical protein